MDTEKESLRHQGVNRDDCLTHCSKVLHEQLFPIIHLYCFKPLNLVDWVQPYYYKQDMDYVLEI